MIIIFWYHTPGYTSIYFSYAVQIFPCITDDLGYYLLVVYNFVFSRSNCILTTDFLGRQVQSLLHDNILQETWTSWISTYVNKLMIRVANTFFVCNVRVNFIPIIHHKLRILKSKRSNNILSWIREIVRKIWGEYS